MLKRGLALFFAIGFAITELGISTNKHVVEKKRIKQHVDTVQVQNEYLFHQFVIALAYVESRHKGYVTSDNNADGQRSYGWVQITPIFVKQANINKHRHETGKFTNTPPKYYTINDAYSIEKSKEMIRWVNKDLFAKYDKNSLKYDNELWHNIIKVHNPRAKSAYRNEIMRLYMAYTDSL